MDAAFKKQVKDSWFGLSVSNIKAEITVFLLFKDTETGCRFLSEISNKPKLSLRITAPLLNKKYKVKISWGQINDKKSIIETKFRIRNREELEYINDKDKIIKVKIGTEDNQGNLIKDIFCESVPPVIIPDVKYFSKLIEILKSFWVRITTIFFTVVAAIVISLVWAIHYEKYKDREKEKQNYKRMIADLRRLDSLGGILRDPSYRKTAIDKYGEIAISSSEFPEEYAKWNLYIGDCKYDFIKVDSDLMRVITLYGEGLKYLPISENIKTYYAFKNNLGNAYNRLSMRRDAFKNLDSAIKCYGSAINCYNNNIDFFTSKKIKSGSAIMNLGSAYSNLSKYENKEANIDSSIKYYLLALKIYNFKDDPRHWANAQKNIAGPYLELMTVIADTGNIYKSINSTDSALMYFTLEDFSNEFAELQVNKAVAFRSLGEFLDSSMNTWKVLNYEKAKKCFITAIRAFKTPSDQTEKVNMAVLQQDLGSLDVITSKAQENRVDKNANIIEAIRYLSLALEVYDVIQYPLDYAKVNEDLGDAYTVLSSIEHKKSDFSKAEECYNGALGIFTESEYASDYARINDDFGDLYKVLASFENQGVNLSIAEDYYNKALKIFTEKDYHEQRKRVNEKKEALHK